MTRNLLLACILLAPVAACTHRVDVALRPDFAAGTKSGYELANVSPPVTFFRGQFTDKRPDPSKLAEFKQGMNTYELHEERPIADVLFEGMRSISELSKQKWSDSANGDVRVDLTFIHLEAVRNAGLINVGATSTLQMKADFVNPKTGDVLYTNVYTGTDKRDQALIGLMGLVKASIDASLVRCMQSVGDDAALAKALTKAHPVGS